MSKQNKQEKLKKNMYDQIFVFVFEFFPMYIHSRC